MQAVLFADRRGAELAPLCENHCPALLALGNRPLLHHTLEDLARAGVTEVLLVVSDGAASVRQACGDGAVWGVRIRYLLSRGEEAPERVLARCASWLRPPFLAARGDVLRGTACAALLAAADARPEAPVLAAESGDSAMALCLVRLWPAALPDLHWPRRRALGGARIALDDTLFEPLADLAGFHRAALRLADATLPGAAGPAPGVDLAPGLRVDRLAEVARESHGSGQVLVGARTWIHRRARLAGPCAVGGDCYVDRDARLLNTVVMPGSYVGEGLHVENAIVDGGRLIRVDLGVCVDTGESKLLSGNGDRIGASIADWPERLLGAALLLASLPLWGLALGLSLAAAPAAPLARGRARVNAVHGRAPTVSVPAWRFATRVPLLRKLPMLWLVVRGDLRLFGARHENAVRAPRLPTAGERVGAALPAGLLGPAQLYLPPGAPEEEIHLWELQFAAERRVTALLPRLVAAARLLASTRAWSPAPAEVT